MGGNCGKNRRSSNHSHDVVESNTTSTNVNVLEAECKYKPISLICVLSVENV